MISSLDKSKSSVLRALGYETGTDFQWDKAWELSDKIRLTDGRYNVNTTTFTRGDVAVISNNALAVKMKNEEQTLLDLVEQNSDNQPSNPIQITPDSLQGTWRKKVTDSAVLSPGGEAEIVFSGNEITYAEYDDSTTGAHSPEFGWVSIPTRYLDYRSGTYQIEGNEITALCQWLDNSNFGRDWGSGTVTLTFEIEELSETSMTVCQSESRRIDDTVRWYIAKGKYEKVEDNAVSTVVENAISNKISIPTTPPGSAVENFEGGYNFTYLAGNSFRMIRSEYPSATAHHAYVTVYTNLEGHLCALTDVWYKIIRNYNEIFLYDITDGRVIRDPQSYYEQMVDRRYGASKIHSMDILGELLEHLAYEQQKATYVSGDELNQ